MANTGTAAMSIRPKISIVLPSYNRANYLAQAIESCLAQTYKNFELIIIDDCSSDNSFEVAYGYAARDDRIKAFKNTYNKKLPATLNIGFAEAKGEYLTWISDDNLFEKTALEKMADILDSRCDIGLVYADYTLIDENGIVGKRLYQEPPDYLPIRDCVGACFLYRAEVAEEVGGYDEEMFLVEDYDYWLKCGLVTKLFHIEESLYFYRAHKESLTQTRKEDIRFAKLRLKGRYRSKYKIPEELQPVYELYMWFIGGRELRDWVRLIWIVAKSPMRALRCVIRNLGRL